MTRFLLDLFLLLIFLAQLANATIPSVPPGHVVYQSFLQEQLNLLRYPGRHVALLLPASVDRLLNARDRRNLIDHLDLLFESFRSLTGVTPEGEGLLDCAVVARIEGEGVAGRGWVGRKGLEIRESYFTESLERIKAGSMDRVLLHEMAHNFDRVSMKTIPLADPAHGFTALMEMYLPIFSHLTESRVGSSDLMVANYLLWRGRLQSKSTRWADCLNDCGGESKKQAEHDWARMHVEYVRLFGAHALQRAFEYWNREIGALTEEEARRRASTGAALDLHLRGLAAGAGQNLGCVYEAWQIPTTKESTIWMDQNYPTRKRDACLDRDGDGVKPVDGDWNDNPASGRSIAVFPADSYKFDINSLPESGQLSGVFAFAAHTRSNERVKVGLRPYEGRRIFALHALSGVGFVHLMDSTGNQLQSFWADPTWPAARSLECTDARGCRLEFSNALGTSESEFRLVSWKSMRAPEDWAAISQSELIGSKLRLQARIDPAQLAESKADRIGFWASGAGFVCESLATKLAACEADWPNMSQGEPHIRVVAFRNGMVVLQDTDWRAERSEADEPVAVSGLVERLRSRARDQLRVRFAGKSSL